MLFKSWRMISLQFFFGLPGPRLVALIFQDMFSLSDINYALTMQYFHKYWFVTAEMTLEGHSRSLVMALVFRDITTCV